MYIHIQFFVMHVCMSMHRNPSTYVRSLISKIKQKIDQHRVKASYLVLKRSNY